MNKLPLYDAVARLLASGWPRTAIVHLLRSNHPGYNLTWLRGYVVRVDCRRRRDGKRDGRDALTLGWASPAHPCKH